MRDHFLFGRAAQRSSGERGAGLVEYALLVALIAIVCLVSVMFFGDETSTKFGEIGESVGAVTS